MVNLLCYISVVVCSMIALIRHIQATHSLYIFRTHHYYVCVGDDDDDDDDDCRVS